MAETSESPDRVPIESTATFGEQPGEEIDRYKLVEEIGVGGMGSVWMAQQLEPVRRNVALKVIKLGMDTREVVVRFEAERQALALMDHPHIAKVFDGGSTSSGRPYFVMEFVQGAPITEYCDAVRAGVQERLELFVKVCEAVQHAHHKGVIHRDLKPGNVLVTVQEGVAVPKVIDFGIAKATSAELTQKTMFTQHAQILGTPEYMAPEQAEMSGLDIDTRADVYSLGVLLYELLTGERPFDIREVLEKGYHELLRTIREEDPMRPSTRVSTSKGRPSSVAAGRRVDDETLSKRLRGELDWVVMKALEKDRNRRYATASSLAADIGHYLRDEPVLAAPPGRAYSLRKLVTRHKKTFGAVAVTTLVLVVGSIGTGIGWWNTVRANAALDVALDEKEKALAEEERQRALAQENASRALAAEAEALARAGELELVADFQASQFASMDPTVFGVRLRQSLIDAAPENRREPLSASLAGLNFTSVAVTALEENLFQRTLEAIDSQFGEQPLIRAQLLDTMAKTLNDLGMMELGEVAARRALSIRRTELGDEHLDTLTSILRLAGTLSYLNQFEETEALNQEAQQKLRRLDGDEQPQRLWATLNLAVLRSRQGKDEAAERLSREVLETTRRIHGDAHLETAKALHNLGSLYVETGRYESAEALLREAYDYRSQALGPAHPSALGSLSGLAAVYHRLGKYEEAVASFREALAGFRLALGDDHSTTLNSMYSLGAVLQYRGHFDQAEPIQAEALERSSRILGDDHLTTLKARVNMAFLLTEMGRFDEAEPEFRRALEVSRRTFGDDSKHTLNAVSNMGFLFRKQERYEEAEPFYRKALEDKRRILGDEHPDTLSTLHSLGCMLTDQGRLMEAMDCFDEALEGRLRTHGANNGNTDDSIFRVGETFERLAAAARDSGDEEGLARSLIGYGSHLLRFGDPAEAERELREGLSLLDEESPEHVADLLRATGDLGAALAAQGRVEEAIPRYLESARRALDTPSNESPDPELSQEIVLRLIEHLEAAGDASEAEGWRSRLDNWKGPGDE